jgi:putative membrane protein
VPHARLRSARAEIPVSAALAAALRAGGGGRAGRGAAGWHRAGLAAGAPAGATALAVTGRIGEVTTWLPLAKVQSVRLVSGPVQRSLGLATVHLDAAGRDVAAEFRDRPAAEAARLTEELPALCRTARQRG